MEKASKKTQEKSKSKARPPALSLESKESQIVALALDYAEDQIRKGTASSQIITHFLKLATKREQTEQKILEAQQKLVVAKTEALQSQKRVEELYADAMESMKRYTGSLGNIDEDV